MDGGLQADGDGVDDDDLAAGEAPWTAVSRPMVMELMTMTAMMTFCTAGEWIQASSCARRRATLVLNR